MVNHHVSPTKLVKLEINPMVNPTVHPMVNPMVNPMFLAKKNNICHWFVGQITI
jgi:hypothetical protein